jgi:hypothetical protein
MHEQAREEVTMNAKRYDVTTTYCGTVHADRDAAYGALMRLDPMRSLSNHLSALGVGDRAIWAGSSQALGLEASDGRRELLFGLVWRFGQGAQHAKLTWRVQLDTGARGETHVSVSVRAQGSDAEARNRVLASWPLVESIALQHAKGLRRAIEDHVDEGSELARPRLRLVV